MGPKGHSSESCEPQLGKHNGENLHGGCWSDREPARGQHSHKASNLQETPAVPWMGLW